MKNLAIVVMLFVVGCGEEHLQWEDAGKIISAKIVPTSFNEALKMSITTDKWVVILRGSQPSVAIGAQMEISTDRRWVRWGDGRRYRISR
jgi:hypothetical protein